MAITWIGAGRFGASVDPGLSLLQAATLWLSASAGTAAEQTAVNQGAGGTGLNAQYGSAGTAEGNDPLLLTHTGTNYLYLPGLASNTATTPYLAASHPSGTTDVICRVSLPDWTPAAFTVLLNQGGYTSFQRILLYVNTNGTLELIAYTAAGATATATSSVATGITDGAISFVRALVEPGSPNGTCKFYTSTDGSSWTQLGTTRTLTGITDLRTSVNNLDMTMGAINSTTANALVSLYRVQIWSGDSAAGGTKVFDADFSTNTGQSTFVESSSNAATVTINRATSGRKSVMVVRPVWLFGTDDYLEVADNAAIDMGATDPFSVLVVGRAWGTQGTNDTLVAKKADVTDTTAGWLLANHGTTALQLQADIGDGAAGTTATSAARVAGERKVWAMVRSVASDNLTTYINTTAGTPVTDATTATLANSEVLRVGRLSGAGTEYADVEIEHVVVVKGTAYDSTQIGQIMSYLAVS